MKLRKPSPRLRLFMAIAMLLGVCGVLVGRSLYAVARTSSLAPPALAFDKEHIHLGDLFVGHDAPVADFKVVNPGERPAIIQHIQTSCGCARVAVSQKSIPPGETAALRVYIKPPTRSASTTSATVLVRSNDPANPVQKLVVDWQIVAPLVFDATEIRLLRVAENEASGTARVLFRQLPTASPENSSGGFRPNDTKAGDDSGKSANPPPPAIAAVVCAPRFLTSHVQRAAQAAAAANTSGVGNQSKPFELGTIRVSAPLNALRSAGNGVVRVTFKGSNEELTLPVVWDGFGKVKVHPESLSLDMMKPGTLVSRKLLLRSSEKLRIVAIASTSSLVEVDRPKSSEPTTTVVLEVKVRAPDTSGPFAEKIAIAHDLAVEPPVEVTVTGLVSGIVSAAAGQ